MTYNGPFIPDGTNTFGGYSNSIIVADHFVLRIPANLDPDAMLVMSLENYDEETCQATKAAILQRGDVGKAPPITKVASAEEGLLVFLDRRGRSTAYASQIAEIIKALKSSRGIQSTPTRTGRQRTGGEEPVTSRIWQSAIALVLD